MTVDLPVVHHRALQATGHIVAGIGEDQWHDPTPCGDWDVHALLNHIVAGNRWVRPLAGGETIAEVGNRLDGDQLGHSPLMAYEASAAEADSVFCEPGAWRPRAPSRTGPSPGLSTAVTGSLDVLVHGWDLAKATGQDTEARSRAGGSVPRGHRARARDPGRQRRLRLALRAAGRRRPPDPPAGLSGGRRALTDRSVSLAPARGWRGRVRRKSRSAGHADSSAWRRTNSTRGCRSSGSTRLSWKAISLVIRSARRGVELAGRRVLQEEQHLDEQGHEDLVERGAVTRHAGLPPGTPGGAGIGGRRPARSRRVRSGRRRGPWR